MIYYKVVSTAVTYREYWRIAGDPLSFLIAAALKTIRVPLDFNMGLPRFEEVIRLASDQLQVATREAMAGPLADFGVEGYRLAFHYTIPFLGQTSGQGAVLWTPGGDSAASILCAGPRRIPFVPQETNCGVLTRWRNGRMIVTGASKPKLSSPPEIEVEHLPKRPLSEVCRRHRDRVDALGSSGVDPLRPEDLEDLLVRINDLEVDYNVARGVYRELTDAEFERLTAIGGDEPVFDD